MLAGMKSTEGVWALGTSGLRHFQFPVCRGSRLWELLSKRPWALPVEGEKPGGTPNNRKGLKGT